MHPYTSFVIPVYNQEENVPLLFVELTTIAEKLAFPYDGRERRTARRKAEVTVSAD